MEMKYFRDVIEPKLISGEIVTCCRQVKYELIPSFIYNDTKISAVNYISDFNIKYRDGTDEVIDIKGYAKPMDIVKRSLLLYRYPDINFKWLILSNIDGGWCEYEYVKKQRAIRKREKSNLKGVSK